MSTRQHKEYLQQFKEYRKQVTSSRENAEKFMVNTGIHTKNGNLTRNYK